MSRFRKLSHTFWHHQYHIVWVPKYRFRILTGQVSRCIRAFTEQQKSEVVELNIQPDHVPLIAMIPPKIAVSGYVGTVKGRMAIRVFSQFKELKKRPYWGNHFWARGYSNTTPSGGGLFTRKTKFLVKFWNFHSVKLSVPFALKESYEIVSHHAAQAF